MINLHLCKILPGAFVVTGTGVEPAVGVLVPDVFGVNSRNNVELMQKYKLY